MANLNKVFILGRLGQDAKKRVTNNGTELLTFSVATSRFWKNQSGEQQEATEWHDVVFWARRPGGLDQLLEFLVTGREVHVEGELRTRTYEKDGQQHRRTEINALRVELTGKRQDGSNGGGTHRGGGGESRGGYQQQRPQGHGNEPQAPPPSEIDIDDIPF